MKCKICSGQISQIFSTLLLEKHDVVYFRCTKCGFIQTEEPYWLSESYTSAINNVDIGPVNRAFSGAKLVEGLILGLFDTHAPFVDYGAGYGVFVRHMRDIGYDFHWTDAFCENIFAKHFIADFGLRYELLTAFEVFEHLVDPIDEIQKMLALSDNIFFTTEIVPEKIKSASDWWYFGPDHGQHVAFFTVAALEFIASLFGMNLCTNGHSMHLLSKQKVSHRAFRFLTENTRKADFARLLLRNYKRPQSLLITDFKNISGYTL